MSTAGEFKMEASKTSLVKLLNPREDHYIIPFFQRGYIWKDEERERLLNDLLEYVEKKEKLFIGAIVLKKNKNEEKIVIDGQQRLTTLCIMASVLRLFDTQNEGVYKVYFIQTDEDEPDKVVSPILIQSRQCNESFKKIMYMDKLQDLSTFEVSNNIDAAYVFFYKQFSKMKAEDKTLPDLSKLLSYISVVTVEVDEKENEQKIFDTMNSLGVSLTTADLLKNYLFNNSETQYFDATWAKTFECDDDTINYWEQDIKRGRLRDCNIEIFLYYFLQIYYFKNRDSNRFEEPDEKLIRKRDSIFNNYKKYIERFKIDKINFTKELISYAEKYKELMTYRDFEDLEQDSGFDRLNYIITTQDCSTVIPYILYISKENHDTEDVKKMYGFLENYLIRRFVSDKKNSNYSDLFTENTIGKIVNFKDLKDFLESKEADASLSIPSDKDICDYLNIHKFSNNEALSVLYLIESTIRSDKECTKLNKYSKYSLEHLMPTKWEKNWSSVNKGYEKDVIANTINTLGNMGMVTQSLNSSLSNKNWQAKLDGDKNNQGLKVLAKGVFSLMKVINTQQWNIDEIHNRTKELAEVLCRIWPKDWEKPLNSEERHSVIKKLCPEEQIDN